MLKENTVCDNANCEYSVSSFQYSVFIPFTVFPQLFIRPEDSVKLIHSVSKRRDELQNIVANKLLWSGY